MRLICLTNAISGEFSKLHVDTIPALSFPKRRDLYHLLSRALNCKVCLFSQWPDFLNGRRKIIIPEQDADFCGFPQKFAKKYDYPKIGKVLNLKSYYDLLKDNIKSDDIILVDNFHFQYVFPLKLLGFLPNNKIIFEFEDDHSIISRKLNYLDVCLAEKWLSPHIDCAILATAGLQERLPTVKNKIVIPGILYSKPEVKKKTQGGSYQLLYSGSLNEERGVGRLVDAFLQTQNKNLVLHITGTGELQKKIKEATKVNSRLIYYEYLPQEKYDKLMGSIDLAINPQIVEHKITKITFPSKIFTYFKSGIPVVSTKIQDGNSILGDSVYYLENDTVQDWVKFLDQFDFDSIISSISMDFVYENCSERFLTRCIRNFFNI